MIVLRDMQGDVQLARLLDEVLAVIGFVGTHGDAPLASFSLLFEHQ